MLKRLLTISRPLAWIWTIGAYLLGMGNFSNFTILSFVEFLFMFFPINFIVYGLNDVYDKRSDRINKYKDNLQGAKIKENEIKTIKSLCLILSLVFIIISIISKNLEHMILSSSLILLAYVYSVPPIRIKSKPPIDSFFGSIGYLIPILIAFTTHSSISEIPLNYLLLIFPLMAGHAIFALRDLRYDKKTSTRTIGVYLGRTKTLIFAISMYLIPLILLNNLFLRAVFAASILLLIAVLIANPKEKDYITGLVLCLFFSINLTLIYFIFQANLG